ncbi:MAG: hypothetical protein WA895_29630 [Streptosporangiaceae bacterium]
METNSWLGFVGRISLPNGPRACAGNGDPCASVSRPLKPTVKLEICEVRTSFPTSLVPVRLNSTSLGWELLARGTVDPRTGNRCPLRVVRRNPVKLVLAVPALAT